MRWASELSRHDDLTAAFAEAADALERQLEGSAPDLLLVFASPDHAGGLECIAALAGRRFTRTLLVGCTASGVIGGAHEAEEGPALSLTAAVLPGVALSGFHVEDTPAPNSAASASAWRERVGCGPDERPKFLLLADPFTSDVGGLVEGLDCVYPGAPKFGGLASGGRLPTENRLLIGKDIHSSGAVGVVFRGDVEVDTLVAQGCRPIGKPMLVTRCHGHLLLELDGRPPLQVLAELYRSLDARDCGLVQHSLFLGIEMRSDAIEYDPGELLVRNILGLDQDSGALAVGTELRPMMVAQFVVRDPHSAEEELRRMLVRERRAAGRPKGALLFSCVGRGAGLFGCADHDTSLFEEQLGPAPLGGFFCNGEIGPVGGTTFLHGYTSAFAIFREAHVGDGRQRPGAR
jgi:small ligand-binding sensory domain FIST